MVLEFVGVKMNRSERLSEMYRLIRLKYRGELTKGELNKMSVAEVLKLGISEKINLGAFSKRQLRCDFIRYKGDSRTFLDLDSMSNRQVLKFAAVKGIKVC